MNIKREILNHQNVEYCNVLVNEVYKIIHPTETQNEYILSEEYEPYAGQNSNKPYYKYVIDKIYDDLENYGVAFVILSNSSGEDKTFIHLFVLFNTMDGIVRFESYGQSELYEIENGRVVVKPGYVLYCARIVEWPTFEQDMESLLTINPGVERVNYWNGIFSAHETIDTSFPMDVVLLNPN